ncbi:MAG: InlB B-repeat-containing protein [Chitinophagaceae bacterium]|nr:InlB B-repeat-containing protein [Chitinophagaceae bacterium]
MKKHLLFLSGLCVMVSTQVLATKRTVNSAATLTSQYTASVDGDTLSFTASIVVTAELAVSKSLVFEGNGYTISVTKPALNDAGVRNTSPSTYRVFNCSGSKTIVFNNLTIKGGILSSSGGAVAVAAATTVKFNSSVISNSESSAGGGGLYNAGTCYISKSYITRNIGRYGGGIYNQSGTLYMDRSTVTENRTSTTNGGGGIENHSSGILYIHNSSFSNNQCGGGAGAINNYGGYAYLINSSFTGNISLAYPGGAIYQDNTGLSGRNLVAINCLFAYNYYTTGGYTASSYTINDVNVVAGTASLYYCTYMSNTTLTFSGSPSSGVLSYVEGNNAHLLAGDGATNDLFTGGSLTGVMNGNGQIQGTGKVFQPLLVNINGQRVPTLKTGSYALGKGCNTRFTDGGGSPALAYRSMTTGTWTNVTGTTTAGMEIAIDQTNLNRAAIPGAGALERTVDNYIILTVRYSSSGTVSGGSVYGDVYPSGTPITVTALPNTGYAFSNWTKDSSSAAGTTTVTGNPLTIVPTVNTNLTPGFTSTTNYSIIYLGNGNTGGATPAISSHGSGTTTTVADNSGNLTKNNFIFDGWNTLENGSGTDYTPGISTYTGSSGANLTLYAKWRSTGAILVLPVSLVSFQARFTNNSKAVQLLWQSVSEKNSDYYEIQRSADGQNWGVLGQVDIDGESSSLKSYSYLDNQPLKSLAYYRLRMIDKDKTVSYSMIRKLMPDHNITRLQVYPNPAKGVLYVEGAGQNTRGIRIINAMGADVTSSCVLSSSAGDIIQIRLGAFAPGLYYVVTPQGRARFLTSGR